MAGPGLNGRKVVRSWDPPSGKIATEPPLLIEISMWERKNADLRIPRERAGEAKSGTTYSTRREVTDLKSSSWLT